jgi:hypothetical protein
MTNRITEFEDAYKKRQAAAHASDDAAPALRRPSGPRLKPPAREAYHDHLREPVYQPLQP